MKTLLISVPVSELLAYREYDREANPVPQIPFVKQYTFAEVVEWVRANGITKPLELSVYEDLALLTDGNHRLAAAHKLGITSVQVNLNYYESLEEFKASFHPQTIPRFKKFAEFRNAWVFFKNNTEKL